MKIRLTMLTGPPVEHYVSPETFNLMQSHLGSGAVKTYNTLTAGRAIIDWNRVVSVSKIGTVKPEGRRNPLPQLKFGLW